MTDAEKAVYTKASDDLQPLIAELAALNDAKPVSQWERKDFAHIMLEWCAVLRKHGMKFSREDLEIEARDYRVVYENHR